jgi:hypothetical protein
MVNKEGNYDRLNAVFGRIYFGYQIKSWGSILVFKVFINFYRTERSN